jgi:hypothetical protein
LVFFEGKACIRRKSIFPQRTEEVNKNKNIMSIMVLILIKNPFC